MYSNVSLLETNENWPTENKQRLFSTFYSKGVSHHLLHLAEIQMKAGVCKSFIVEKKKTFRYAPIGGSWRGQARGGQNRTRASYVIGYGSGFGFPWFGPMLEAGTEIREAGIIDQILAILVQTTGHSLTFQAGCCRLWVRVLFLYRISPLSLCIFSLSCWKMFSFSKFIIFSFACPSGPPLFNSLSEALHLGCVFQLTPCPFVLNQLNLYCETKAKANKTPLYHKKLKACRRRV